jgi:hypothetical protein
MSTVSTVGTYSNASGSSYWLNVNETIFVSFTPNANISLNSLTLLSVACKAGGTGVTNPSISVRDGSNNLLYFYQQCNITGTTTHNVGPLNLSTGWIPDPNDPENSVIFVNNHTQLNAGQTYWLGIGGASQNTSYYSDGAYGQGAGGVNQNIGGSDGVSFTMGVGSMRKYTQASVQYADMSLSYTSVPWDITFTLDYNFISYPNTAPTVPTITSPTWDANLNTLTPTINWTFNDPDAGDSQSAYFVEIINSSYTASLWNSGWQSSTTARSYTIPSGVLGQGQYYVRMRTKDAAGVISTTGGNGPDPSFYNVRFITDTVAPTITSVGISYNDTDKSGVISSRARNTAAGGTYRVWALGVSDGTSGLNRVQFPTWTADTAGQDDLQWYNGIRDGSTNDWYVDIPVNNHKWNGIDQDRTITTHVYAFDNSGNFVSYPVYCDIDRTPPTFTSVDSYAYLNTATGTRRVSVHGFSEWHVGTTYCNYTTPDAVAHNSNVCTASGTDYYFDVPLSQQGEYRVDFYAQDGAGNWSNTWTARFFVDTNIPSNPNATASSWTTNSATITWNAFSDTSPSSGLQKFSLTVGEWTGSAWVGGTPNILNGATVTGTSYNVTGLTPGKVYRYTVTATDNSGNTNTAVYNTFTTKKQVGTYKFSDKNGNPFVVPLYDPTLGISGPTCIRAAGNAGVIGCFQLVATNDPNSTHFHVKTTTNGVMAISKI